ncbi:hypothetical protein ACFXKI_50280 [Streptomyces mirabilis]|uniref:hypothetical protein n=1 Tax=Streptomyces mirabilis TaxID=68239 RepID=UPI0036ACAFCA
MLLLHDRGQQPDGGLSTTKAPSEAVAPRTVAPGQGLQDGTLRRGTRLARDARTRRRPALRLTVLRLVTRSLVRMTEPCGLRG